ncbi:hypothetical protein OIU74_021051 [Salix koriyanagi]|uniref:Uncharacterized protein n=1 Tax=Salix koriyanagi TaxID=2511006 RepID=A0A9Q0P784_9ROSI|nr:hypothetical protein OIU74_021051 [Salix koriyanagi]
MEVSCLTFTRHYFLRRLAKEKATLDLLLKSSSSRLRDLC